MKTIRIIVICFLITIIFSAQSIAATNIISLPFTCSTAGEEYILENNLTSASGQAITVSADNIIINGNNKNLTYAMTGPGVGIGFSRSCSNIQIRNIVLIQGAGGGNGIDMNNNAFNGLSVHDSMITLNRVAGHAIDLTNFSQNISGLSIYNNTIEISPSSGSYGHGIAVDGSSGATMSGAVYGNLITMGSNLSSAYPSCISFLDVNGSVDFHHNVFTMKQGDTGQGFRFWNSDGHTIRNNTIYMNGVHMRGINIDGGSDHNTVSENLIYMNTISGEGSSGIRIRFASSYNDISNNTVDATNGSSCYALRYGESQSTFPSGPPVGNSFHENTLIGPSPMVRIENANLDSAFYCNQIRITNTGYAYSFWGTDSQRSVNLTFAHEVIEGAGSYSVLLSGTGSPYSNVVFSNCGIETGDIITNGFSGWSVDNINTSSYGPCMPGSEGPPPASNLREKI